MAKKFTIELDPIDLGQLLDALAIRAEAWDKTAQYHRTGQSPPDFIVEECNSAAEAERLAQHYRAIIDSIRRQTQPQRGPG